MDRDLDFGYLVWFKYRQNPTESKLRELTLHKNFYLPPQEQKISSKSSGKMNIKYHNSTASLNSTNLHHTKSALSQMLPKVCLNSSPAGVANILNPSSSSSPHKSTTHNTPSAASLPLVSSPHGHAYLQSTLSVCTPISISHRQCSALKHGCVFSQSNYQKILQLITPPPSPLHHHVNKYFLLWLQTLPQKKRRQHGHTLRWRLCVLWNTRAHNPPPKLQPPPCAPLPLHRRQHWYLVDPDLPPNLSAQQEETGFQQNNN